MGRLKLFGEPEGGGTDDHSALSNLDYDHSGHSGFVPSQGEALIDILRLNQNLIRDSEGNDRITLSPASPHLTLTGDQKVTGALAVKGSTPNSDTWLKASPTYPSFWRAVGIECNPLTPSINADFGTFYAVSGSPSVFIPTGGYYCSVGGLRFLAGVSGGTGATQISLRALDVRANTMFFAGDMPELLTALFGAPGVFGLTGTIGHVVGVDIGNMSPSAHIGDATSLRIANQSTVNTGWNRLIEAGPATPYLRLVGGGDPPADKSNLYLKFGSTLYRVIKSGSYMTLEAA